MDSEKALNHAWNYFCIHAQQRMTTFNFYIVLVGLIITYIASSFLDFSKNAITTAPLGLFLIGISFIFYKLDERISFLIKYAEDIIKKHEPNGASIFKDEHEYTKIATKKGQWTYGRSFRTIFFIMSVIGFLIFTLSMCMIIDWI